MPASPRLTEILHWIDPTALDPEIQNLLEQIGPYLARDLTYLEIGPLLAPPRSGDWVSAKVSLIRQAFVEEALRHRDGMSSALRERLEALAAA